MSDPLKYQCSLLVGGAYYHCIESYEAVHTRWRESGFKIEEGERMEFFAPLELTVGLTFDEEGNKRLVRAAFSPSAIAGIYEIPADLANEAP